MALSETLIKKVKAYLGIPEAEDLPVDVEIMLESALTMIEYAIFPNKISCVNKSIIDNAVLMQFIYEKSGKKDKSKVASFSIGSYSESYKNNTGDANKTSEYYDLAPEVRRYLMLQGLLYRKVRNDSCCEGGMLVVNGPDCPGDDDDV